MGQPSHSGQLTAAAVSVASLALVWGLVWANLPSKEELFVETPLARPEILQAAPELDLTIPGVSTASPSAGDPQEARHAARAVASEGAHAKQIAELKCEAEVQQVCPGGLNGDERRQCVELRIAQMSPTCQEVARRQVVKWKVALDYRTACLEDLARYCQDIKLGDEGRVPCLQGHAQALSDRCYQSLPKGTLHYKR